MKKTISNFIAIVLSFSLLFTSCNNTDNSKHISANTDSSKFLVKHPDWIKTANIYEVNLRQFTKSGTINEFRKQLPRLKEMGVEIVWFMPINPIGIKNRKAPLGSYYSVKDYTTVNPEFGSMADFKAMVKEIHDLGMHVIIDWVANHTAWDHKWTADHPDFYEKDSTGKFMPPAGTDWVDVIQLNYKNK